MNIQLPFADDTFIPQEFLKLKNEYNIKIAVETGTHVGDTTYWLAENFDLVYTIEKNSNSLFIAKEKCKNFTNINFCEGFSNELLEDVISKIHDKQVIFFLDAHGDSPCPTVSELKIIKKMEIKPVICIHDFYVPNEDFGWDIYKDFEYKWENIEKLINEIYGEDNYVYYYNSEANGYKRGIVYIKPKFNL